MHTEDSKPKGQENLALKQQKRTYSPPEMRKFGKLQDLVKGGTLNLPDGVSVGDQD